LSGLIEKFGFVLIKVIESVGKSLAELYEKEEMKAGDFERILLVLKNISDYTYNKYGV